MIIDTAGRVGVSLIGNFYNADMLDGHHWSELGLLFTERFVVVPATTVFTLSRTAVQIVSVTLNGSTLDPNDYSLTGGGTTVTLNSQAGVNGLAVIVYLVGGSLPMSYMGGSGATNQVAYWSAATTLAGDTGLTFDPSANTLTVAGGLNVGAATGAPSGTINFGTSAGVQGGFLISTYDAQAIVAGGAYWNGAAWIARATSANAFGSEGAAGIIFYSNSGLTVGNSFTPTERFKVTTTGVRVTGSETITLGLNIGTALSAATGQIRLTNGAGGGSIIAYDAGWRSLFIDGSSIELAVSGNTKVTLDASFNVTMVGGLNMGTATGAVAGSIRTGATGFTSLMLWGDSDNSGPGNEMRSFVVWQQSGAAITTPTRSYALGIDNSGNLQLTYRAGASADPSDTTSLTVAPGSPGVVTVAYGLKVGTSSVAPATGQAVAASIAKATASTSAQFLAVSNDASDQLELLMGIIGSATAGSRRGYIQAVEQNVAYRDLSINSSGGDIWIGAKLRPGGTANTAVYAQSTGTVVNNGTLALNGSSAFYGLISIVEDGSTGYSALYYIATGPGSSTEVVDVSGKYTPTQGSAGSTNLYVAANVLTLENKLGVSASYQIIYLGYF